MGFAEYNARNRGRAAEPYRSNYPADKVEEFGRKMALGLEEIDSINDQVFAVATAIQTIALPAVTLAFPAAAPAAGLAGLVLDGLKDAVDGDGKFDKTRILKIIEAAKALDTKPDADSHVPVDEIPTDAELPDGHAKPQ